MAWDCHIHMLLDGRDWKDAIRRHQNAPDTAYIRGILGIYQAAGVTYLRDGGDRWGVGKAAREIAAEYGIVYRTPLAPLYRRGHYGGFIGTGYDSLGEYARLAEKTRQDGGDFVKIMISGLMDFDRYGVLTEAGLPPAEIRELVHIAHQEGMAVMAHANGARTVEAAAEAGVDSIEHGAYLDTDALAAMAAAGTVWVPTLSAIGNLRGKRRFSEYAVEKILENAQANVAEFAAMGGLVAAGSDAGAWAVPHGCGTEERLLAQALPAGADILRRGGEAIRRRFCPPEPHP